MDTEFLESLGLTKNESRVYVTLMELGRTSINGITEKLGLHRRTIYDCLIRLEQKGLVSHVIEEKTKIFYTQTPDKLLTYLNDKEEELLKEREKLQVKLPSLKLLFEQTSQPNKIMVYKGIRGLKQIFEEILKEKPKEYYAFGSTENVRKIIPEFLDIVYAKYKKLGIKIKAVVINTPERIRRAKELNKTHWHEIRVMNSKTDSPLTTYIVNKKTIFMVWSEPNPYAIILEDEKVTLGFKNYFISLWNNAKKP